VTIRQATPADLPAAYDVLRAAFTPYTALIGRPPAPLPADLTAAQAAGQLWVAPGGIMVCQAQGDALEIDILAIDPAHQGRGLGTALVANAEAIALHTNAVMEPAQRLYSRAGFTLVARKQDDGFDRVFFRKALVSNP
jgi:ribosomal protein S18 acetylase RimI-like enzyme